MSYVDLVCIQNTNLMDLETIIIAVISLLICCLPFWIMIRNRKKNERKMINELTAISGKGQLKLTKYELSSNFIIAFDESENKLHFLSKTKNGDKSQILDLNNFENCEIIRIDHAENENSPKIIKSISLRFLPANKQSELVILSLFNSEETDALSGELQLANEWCQFLKERITSTKSLKN